MSEKESGLTTADDIDTRTKYKAHTRRGKPKKQKIKKHVNRQREIKIGA